MGSFGNVTPGGKSTALIQHFSNQYTLKALYNIAEHSPIHAHIHQLTLRGAGDLPVPANPLYLLSHMRPPGEIGGILSTVC